MSNILIENVTDTEQLTRQLHSMYPALEGFPYLIAVEKEIISSNTALADNYTVALLPPYAGG